MDDTGGKNNGVNPDSEAEMLFSEEEAEEPGQSSHNKVSTIIAASSQAPAKEHSKQRALKKAEKKLLLQRIHGVSTVFLWQEISCRLNETIHSDLESASGKTENGDLKKPSESAATVTLNDDYRLGKQLFSFPTAKNMKDIVLHLRDTFMKLYSNCEGQ